MNLHSGRKKNTHLVPFAKVWPVSSGAWILPSNNAPVSSPVPGRRRGGHPFAPLAPCLSPGSGPYPEQSSGPELDKSLLSSPGLERAFALKLQIRKQH